ncbi:GNAT family N-acetyltransferase [Pantoea sp. FN060301]|uniref:GNAT family N-acetyltransferase n=1 Tax=Pantoea sp. FN060301 TaxID=3420380 RepID=UPI003D16A7E6
MKTLISYEELSAEQAVAEQAALAEVISACVALGASIGFISQDPAPVTRFWQGAIAGIASGDRRLLVARQQERIVATVMLQPGGMPNGSHRAEIAKLLVHPSARRQGIAREMMLRVEQMAKQMGLTLLVLDTRTGDVAEQLYRSLGWQTGGQIPHYAQSTGGAYDATTLMYKLI